uniref:Carbamoyl phosphate synthase small chain n=1 Tax=Candidatus Methanomethylicus mesodigestus TaxID=1867258 RepID=A0A7C3IRV8_9CREN
MFSLSGGKKIKAYIVLEDGSHFEGEGFGYPACAPCEVVFNTGMVGYPESLTDPSYSGQLLIQTYPLIGSYGVPPMREKDEYGLLRHFESDRVQVAGFGVAELQKSPSHWQSETDLAGWLFRQKVPAIEGIDTREITKILRSKGTMWGMIGVGDDLDLELLKLEAMEAEERGSADLVKGVSVTSPIEYDAHSKRTIAVIDCGVKFSIIRELLSRGLNVLRVPYDSPAGVILRSEPDGILISNGPGDPARCARTISTAAELLETGIPMMGICLGTQIIALAAGAATYKLPYGHRGQNQPCLDLSTGRCYITSQNHGYAVDSRSLQGTGFKASFVNVNDGTVEGLRHEAKPIFGVQFHPEASPGPCETSFLFDEFTTEVENCHR